jgi:peptidoglycan/LPS O-acetylase OafA/YrhL
VAERTVSRRSGALVPAGWAAYNGLWLALLAGLGGNATVLWLYGGATAIAELFAGAVVISGWRHPLEPRRHLLARHGEASLLGALGVAFAGLGVVFGAWFYPMAAVLLAFAVSLAAMDVRDRHRPPAR